MLLKVATFASVRSAARDVCAARVVEKSSALPALLVSVCDSDVIVTARSVCVVVAGASFSNVVVLVGFNGVTVVCWAVVPVVLVSSAACVPLAR